MKVVTKTESPLLSRTMYSLMLEHPGKTTPSKKEVTTQLLEVLQTKENLLMVKKIETKFGQGKSKVTAFVYKTEKDLQEIEIKKKKPKKGKANAQEQKSKKQSA